MNDDARAEMYGRLSAVIGAYLCETFFFGATTFLIHSTWLSQETGIYSAVFLFSSVFMLSKRPSTPVRNSMLAVSTVMYAVCAVHWAMNMSIAAKFLRIGEAPMSPFELLVVVYLPTINYILSDGIVVWRAWVLWGPSRRFRVFVPLLFSLVCTLVLSAVGAAYLYTAIEYKSERSGTVSRYIGWTVWGLSIGTNLWATGLICIKTWQHRRSVRALLGKGTATSTAEKVLIFMVESGTLYLCIWVAYMISTFTQWEDVLFLDTAIVQVVGIYPMTIVLLVTMRLSTVDVLSMSDPEAFEPPISIRCTSPDSPDSLPIEDVGGFLESGCDVVPHEGGSSGTLVYDCSER
ncbi:hypothetical protein EDB92DRAFT_1941458 [Lactarius akahatsu]|uniref:Uncharacterized protein n=1 Tax=Lactarius akahatsu TaxID=416441 RepID=A0AAD4LPA0_9AGAM|nr:hypothetical protein EDB92DRAFT_1941458 [Lactarius akahatsu]